MRKGKSTSVDLGEGAKEEEEATEGGEGGEAGGADGEDATAAEETNDKEAAVVEKTEAAEEEKMPAEAPVTNGENGCSNGTAEEHATHNHQEEEKTTGGSPVKKTKEAGTKEEANAKIINDTAAVNSGELEYAKRDSDEPQNSNSNKEGDTNRQQQQQTSAQANTSCKQTKSSCQQPELELVVSRMEEEEGEGGEAEAEAPQNGGCHDGAESCNQGEREGEEEEEEEEEEEMRKRDLRDAAVAIVQNVMSAATTQLERELCIDNGLNGCYDDDI